MTKVLYSKTTQVSNGTYGNQETASSFIRATEADYRRYYRCDFGIKIIVMEGLDAYANIDGGSCTQSAMPHGNVSCWPNSFINASIRNFRMKVPANTGPGYYQMCEAYQDGSMSSWYTMYKSKWDGTGDTAGSSWYTKTIASFTTCVAGSGSTAGVLDSFTIPQTLDSYTADHKYRSAVPFAKATDVPEGTEVDGDVSAYMTAKGYVPLGNLAESDWVGSGEGAIYVGGLALFNESTSSGTQFEISAARIVIPDLYQLLDYYPWARMAGGEWMSHNRQGGSLRRYNGGWKDVKNSYGSGASKAFRHNGSTWAKSPKTGRE